MTDNRLDLSPLVEPRTVAIIGASESGHYSSSIFHNLTRSGFPSKSIFPVNPKRTEVFGLRSYGSVKDISSAVDLAVVVVPRSLVLPVAQECGEKGVRAISVISSGFAETGNEGKQYQDELAAIVRSHGMSFLGPNTLGHVCPRSKTLLWSTSLADGLPSGGLAAIFHSSGMLNLLFSLAADRGLGFSLGIAPGNEAGLTLSDFLSWAVEDPETKVIALVIESMRDPLGFRAALEHARKLRKPIVALRLGRTARAKRSIVSHTGSLAATGEAWDAFFDQMGVIQVANLDELAEAAVMSSWVDSSRLKESSAGLITISGGDCSLLSDICERVGLTLPDLDAETRRIVAQELKKDSFLGNPLDVEDLLLSNTDGFYGSVEAFAKMPAFGAIGVRLNIPEKLSDSLRQAYSRIADIVRLSGKQVVFFSRASEQMDRAWFDLFSSLQVPFLLEYEKGLKTLRAAIGSAQRWARPVQSLSINGERRIPENLKQMLSFHPGGPLPIRSALALFQEYGLPFAYTELARTAEEAKELAQKIGFPVVVKSASVEIPHRSEIGAVRINLKTPSDVEGAYDEVMAKCKEAHPGARLEGVAVQPMIQGVAEVILGVSRDPQLGPVILLGIGGIFVEVLKDVVLRVPPLDTQDCWEMVESLRGKALLFGARGRPRADIEELTQAILAVSRLALDFRQEIEELDLNPVVVCAEGKGVVAVDGLVVMRTDSEAIDEG